MKVSPEVRWGILGAGKIARRFAADLVQVPGARLVAVGSLSADRATTFAQEFGLSHYWGSYEALVEDPQVDVVYVATRHQAHVTGVRLALEAGRAVLCEKPFTLDAREAKTLIELARTRRLFLMEAMWTRFFPLMIRVRELVAAEAIGEVRRLDADFGFRADFDPESRLFNPAQGGGALLDVGVYTISLASMLFGAPTRAVSQACLGPTGVDEQAAMVLAYEGGRLAVLSAAICVETSKEATLWGTTGGLRIHAPLWKPDTMTWIHQDGVSEQISMPYPGNGFQFEIEEVMRCLREGKLESPVMPLDETLTIMQTMDMVRAQWTLKQPQ